MTAHPPLHNPDRKPTATAAGTRAARRKRNAGLTPEEMCRQMPAAELAHNARKGGVAAIAEQERRAAEAAEDTATPAPGGRWLR